MINISVTEYINKSGSKKLLLPTPNLTIKSLRDFELIVRVINNLFPDVFKVDIRTRKGVVVDFLYIKVMLHNRQTGDLNRVIYFICDCHNEILTGSLVTNEDEEDDYVFDYFENVYNFNIQRMTEFSKYIVNTDYYRSLHSVCYLFLNKYLINEENFGFKFINDESKNLGIEDVKRYIEEYIKGLDKNELKRILGTE